MLGGAKGVVGLDIGSSGIKMVHLKKAAGGAQLTAFGYVPLPHEGVIVDGAIVDTNTVSEMIKEVFKASKIKPSNTVAGFSAQNVILRHIKVPVMKDDELSEAIKFEAEQYVPYAMEDVALSYAKLSEIEEEGMGQFYILLVCAQKETLSNYLKTLKMSGVVPKVVDVDNLGIANALHMDIGEEEIIAVIDIGAATTNINIFSNGVLDFHRNISIAGNNITSIIQSVLKLEFAQAETIKKEEGVVSIDEGDTNEVSEVIRTSIEELASEIRRSFDFFKAQTRQRSIDKIILTGGSAKLKNLDVFLANELGIEVEVCDAFRELSIAVPNAEELEEFKLELTAAIGLALREVMD